MPLYHKKAGLSGGDDRRSLTETLNEMESVLSREKKRRRRILHRRQTCCISLAEVAVIIFPDRIIILKIVDKSHIR